MAAPPGPTRSPSSGSPTPYAGERLGLPEDGPGSVASMGTRTLAWLLDIVLSALVAWFFTAPAAPQNLSLLVWAGMTMLSVGLFGFTPGQAVLGIRVAPVNGRSLVGWWAIPRTALIFVIVPVLIVDPDIRGLHDRWCRTVVVRTR